MRNPVTRRPVLGARSECRSRRARRASEAYSRTPQPSPQLHAELRRRFYPERRKGPDSIRRSHPSPLYLGVASGASRCAFLLPNLRWRELGPYLGPPS
jgi:hypothetical protein